MYKELIIVIIIIIAVITVDITTQNYTKECIGSMQGDLSNLKQSIVENNQNGEDIENSKSDEITKIADRVINNWNNIREKLVYYLEHDELEKVSSQLYQIKGLIDIQEESESIPEIDKCEFILNHIIEKEAFNFKNIF